MSTDNLDININEDDPEDNGKEQSITDDDIIKCMFDSISVLVMALEYICYNNIYDKEIIIQECFNTLQYMSNIAVRIITKK
jgi:hypothetical protein